MRVTGRNCNMNRLPDGNVKSLFDEPGIPELEQLYYDIYNFRKGKFVGMRPETKKIYQDDLLKFYTSLTGEKKLPTAIENGKTIQLVKKFSDIKLPAFHTQDLCTDKSSRWHKSYSGTKNDGLFKKYAKHLTKMTKDSQKLEQSLLEIINEIFAYKIDKNSKSITINPKLNYKQLTKLTAETRENIIDLYIGCEKDFQEGIKIFEAIILSRLDQRAASRKQALKKESKELRKSVPDLKEEHEKEQEEVQAKEDVETPVTIPEQENVQKLPAEQQQIDTKKEHEIPKPVANIPSQEPAQVDTKKEQLPPVIVQGGTRKRRKRRRRRKSRKLKKKH